MQGFLIVNEQYDIVSRSSEELFLHVYLIYLLINSKLPTFDKLKPLLNVMLILRISTH